MFDENLNRISGRIIGACIEVHKALGPGLLEQVYKECLCAELEFLGIGFVTEVKIPVLYRGVLIETMLRADLIVENEIIVELKSVLEMNPVYEAQLLTYLKLMNKKMGLLINFNTVLLKHGIKRLLNNPMKTTGE